jgi:enoyl-CoA hydratase/carnithine racemase
MSDPLGLGELEAIRFRLDDNGVAWLTLARPEAGNSRNQRMRDELGRVYAAVSRSTVVKVLVLTGEGERFFCVGMDLKEASSGETSEQRRARLLATRDIDLLAALPVPTIAAVNGYALGGGLEMALACDLRVAVEDAEVGLPELTHGLVPGGGGTQRLPRLIGVSATLELLYLADRISGLRAAEVGLVNLAVPRSELISRTAELAARIAAQPVAAVRAAKELVRLSAEVPLSAGLGREIETLLALLDARDSASSG